MKVSLLTQRIVEDAPAARKYPYFIMEDGGRGAVHGFGARIHRRIRQWIARYSHDLYTIARCDLMDVQEARRLARAWLLQKTTGAAGLALPAPDPSTLELATSSAGTPPSEPPPLAQEPRADRTVGELHARYVEDTFGDLRARTRQEYLRCWRLHLEPRFASLDLLELQAASVWKMRTEMTDRPRAFNAARQQLRACLEHGIALEWLPQGNNKVDLVPKLPFERKERHLYFTAEEYQRLGEALRRAEWEGVLHYPALAAMWVIITTGCRPSEVLGARREWAELEGDTPSIAPPTHKGQRKGRRSVRRVLWLHAAVAEKLRRIDHPAGNPWLIPGKKPGRALYRINETWRAVCKRAGIENSIPYSARHSYRSEAAEAEIQVERVQALLGHRPGSKITDQTYLHTHEHQTLAAARRMDEHLGRLVGLASEQVEGEG